MRLLLLLATLACVTAQDIFVPYFETAPTGTGNNLLNGIIAFWRFEETTGNALDSNGNAHPLAPGADYPASGPGIVGNEHFYLKNTIVANDYFTRAREAVFAFPNVATTGFTISTWAKFTQEPPNVDDQAIIARGDYGGGVGTDFSWGLMLDNGGFNDFINFFWSSSGTFNIANKMSYPMGGGETAGDAGANWWFIVVRGLGNTISISATEAGSPLMPFISTNTFGGSFHDGTAALRVGDLQGSTIHSMNGDIDELGVWDRALTDCEVAWLYTSQAGSFTWPGLAIPCFDALGCSPPVTPGSGTDNFDAYADGSALGAQAGWATVAGTMSVSGGKVYSNTGSAITAVRRTTPAFGANQRAWVTLSGTTTGNGTVGPGVRLQPGTADGYGLYWDRGGTHLYLFTVVGGSYSGVADKIVSYVDGDKLRISATGTGAALRLRAEENRGYGWVTIWGDQLPVNQLNSGQPGVVGYNNIGALNLSANDWSAEEF